MSEWDEPAPPEFDWPDPSELRFRDPSVAPAALTALHRQPAEPAGGSDEDVAGDWDLPEAAEAVEPPAVAEQEPEVVVPAGAGDETPDDAQPEAGEEGPGAGELAEPAADATLRTGPVIVLLVEDEPNDQELTRRGLEQWQHDYVLHVVGDGEEALDYLLRRGDYQDPARSPRPDLILLDLALPKIDGARVLAEIRGRLALSSIPVVVLATSVTKSDVIGNYEMGANSYLVKPDTDEGYADLLSVMERYWLQTVVLPPRFESA